MKSMTSIALALATALTVPLAMAQGDATQPPKSKCVPPAGADCPAAKSKKPASAAKEKDKDTDKDTAAMEAPAEPETPAAPEPAAEPMPPPTAMGGGPTEQEPPPPTPTATTVTQTTTVTDQPSVMPARQESERHVRRGFGVSAFGSAGAADEARWGVGGRIEYVAGFGLAIGGSYAVHIESEGDRTQVRPLLGEIGWTFAVANHLEVRPMVGLGWAFASASRDTFTNAQGQTVRVATTDGVDVAPGAKLSYVARMLEIYTMPKYHFISGNNFAAIELGAGARF